MTQQPYEQPYEVAWKPSGRRDLAKLHEAVAAAVVELIYGDLSLTPHRLCGPPLHAPHEGLFRAKRGGYRILCRIDDDRRVVTIEQIKARPDAYRR